MIEYTWKIKQIDRLSTTGEVINVRWTVLATKDSHTSSTVGATNINYSEEYTFIPFENLTEETVLSWTWNIINKTEIEEKLATDISNMETPVIISGLPWN